MGNLLYIIAVILVIAWAVGFFSSIVKTLPLIITRSAFSFWVHETDSIMIVVDNVIISFFISVFFKNGIYENKLKRIN